MISKKIFLFVMMSTMISLVGCFPQSVISQSIVVHDIAESDFELLWSRSNVYTIQDDFRPAMSANFGLLCILGDIKYPPEKEISCVDGISGDIKWQKLPGNAVDVAVAHNGTYIAYSGTSGVEKYDCQGNLLWSRSLAGMGVMYFYLYSNTIQLYLHPARFLVLNAETGDEIADTKDVDVILETSTEVFTKDSFLESRDLDSNKVNWSVEIGGLVRLKPLFTKDNIFLKTEKTIGSVMAVNRQTGEVAWRTDRNIISNVVYLPQSDQIVAMTDDGALISINVSDETQKRLVKFSAPPFFLNGEENVGGYELAFDENSNILYVLLGDSRQLFAFRLK